MDYSEDSSVFSEPDKTTDAPAQEHDEASNFRSEQEDDNETSPLLNRQEDKMINRWRWLLLVVLLLVGIGICAGTYLFVSNEHDKDFVTSFNLFANSIQDSLQKDVINLKESLRNLGDTITASAEGQTELFPRVLVNHFEIHGEHARKRSKLESIIYAPLVGKEQQDEWVEFAVENQGWIEQSRATFVDRLPPNETLPVYVPGSISPYIYRRRDGAFDEPSKDSDPMVPIWYLSPPPSNPAIVNYDLYASSELQKVLKQAIEYHSSSFSPVIDVEEFLSLQVSDADHYQFHQDMTDVTTEKTGYTQPHSFIAQPVFSSSQDSVVVGVLLGTVAFDTHFVNILPEGVVGISCVLRFSCMDNSIEPVSYTYELHASKLRYVGKGDFHDPTYAHLRRSVPFFVAKEEGRKGSDASVCMYEIDIYPSDDFKELYESNLAVIASSCVVLTFVVVAIIFLVFDRLVKRRNKMVTTAAKKSDAVVRSLFPAEVRDRLMADEDSIDLNKHSIADLFPESTVLFMDIAGFTAWCSTREPQQVFVLLETIYGAFDDISRRRHVFKVETIGDCYVAVSGVPKPRPDHAVVMVRYARDCLHAFYALVKTLEVTLGPETGELGLRVGLHSGPVTAGVLRGDRARFQLFGDTMNTTARVESNGEPNKIHCSEETAVILKEWGKEHWLEKRRDKIEAKGKGQLQTYWIVSNSKKGSSTVSSSTNGEAEDDTTDVGNSAMKSDQAAMTKRMRLIEWNIDLLMKLLKDIAQRRRSRSSVTAVTPPDEKVYASGNSGASLISEVAETIRLPDFDGLGSLDNDKVVLSPLVEQELRTFVKTIASFYNDVPFHNFEHASHVTMSVAKLLARIVSPRTTMKDQAGEDNAIGTESSLHDRTFGITSDPLTQFSCVLSALIHDADHQGVPNAVLVKEGTDLAKKYKDKSVAEQHSVHICWDLLMTGDYKELRAAIYETDDELKRFRQLIVNSVMATDIVDPELKALRNARWEKAFSPKEMDENTASSDSMHRKGTIVIEHLIQASDIAHTMQHWHIYRKWNERFFRECYGAFLEGRIDKDPTPGWYKGEIGFFQFYVIPLAKKLKECGAFGVCSDEYLNYAQRNLKEWELRGQELVAKMVEAMVPKC